MTIKNAIEELKQVLKQTNDAYITNRLECIIEDLSAYMNSPDKGEEYKINATIAKHIENESTHLVRVDHSWVNTLYCFVLNMFRHEECKQYYGQEKNRKEIKKVIDGETSSKWVELISAIWTILACFTALIWFSVDKTGFSTNADGTFDFDKWGFIIVLGSAVLVIVVSFIVAVVNAIRKKKYRENADLPYSIDEFLAVEYEHKPKLLRLLFPMAAKISKCQIAIGNGNRQSQGNRGKAKNGGKLYQNAGDVKEGEDRDDA